MYVSKKQATQQLLSIDDAKFASVASINDDSIDVNVTFYVAQGSVIKQNVTSVNVYVKSKNVSKTSVLKGVKNNVLDNKKLIRNILVNFQLAKSSITQKDVDIIEYKSVSALAGINKQMIGRMCSVIDKLGQSQLATLSELYEKQYTLENVSSLRSAYIERPLLDRYTLSPKNETYDNTNIASVRRDLLLKHRIDSSVVTLTKQSATYAHSSMSGVSRENKNYRFENQLKLDLISDYVTTPEPKELTTNSMNDNDVVVGAQLIYVDQKSMTVRINLPYFENDTSQYNVVLEAQDVSGNVLETFTKKIDVSSLVLNATTPHNSPIVPTSITSKKSFTFLTVNLNNDHADYVTVYKRSISNVQPQQQNVGYELVYDKLPTHAGKATLMIDASNISSTNVYRVIPVGSSKTLCAEYANVIVAPERYRTPKVVSVSAYSTRNGVIVEVRSFRNDVVSVQVMKRDLTLRVNTYSYVGSSVLVSSALTETMFFVDNDSLKETHVYEYVAKLTYKSGVSSQAGSYLLEYLPFVDGISTRVSDLSVSDYETDLDVTFNLSTVILSTNTDDVKMLLEKQGMLSYFNNDILNDRDKLQSLIAHNVIRVNLTNGAREDFGVITEASFSDRSTRTTLSISDLDRYCDYRYEVSALIRSPETMLESYVKTGTDKNTNKLYKYKPVKFLHPNVLSRGGLSSVETTKLRHAKKSMMFGKIGNVEKIDVSFTRKEMSMTDVRAYQQDYKTVVVTWKIDSVQESIDHFIVSKVINNIKKIIGKSHAHFPNGNCKLVYKLTSEDKGDIMFVVLPVLNDFRNGDEQKSNSLRIL